VRKKIPSLQEAWGLAHSPGWVHNTHKYQRNPGTQPTQCCTTTSTALVLEWLSRMEKFLDTRL